MRINKAMGYVLDFKKGDVNGDGIKDYVYLIGNKPFGDESPARSNIRLMVIDGYTKRKTIIKLKEDSGYDPTLFLGDFTRDKIDDVLISIASGGSGGTVYYYIYTFASDHPRNIFDFEVFDEEFDYDINYLDDYKAEVICKANNKKYILDLTYKGQEYLSEIYNPDGTLKEPIMGWVDPLSGLYPIDFQRDGTYELYAEQLIAGRYHADGLGYVQTSLKWNGKSFVPFYQTVGIPGKG